MSYDVYLIILPAARPEQLIEMLGELAGPDCSGPCAVIAQQAISAWSPDPRWPDSEPDGTPGYGQVFDANMTSNVAPMWREAGCNLRDFDRKAARELVGPLGDALAVMAREPARFEAMNPPNGWGDFATCAKFLLELWLAAVRYPYAELRVSS